MKTLEWTSDREFSLDGVQFRCDVGDYSGKTNSERFVLLKDKSVLEQYAKVFAEEVPKNILEFGIFQGGSPALFSLWFDLEKFVGIDNCKPVAAFDAFCVQHPIGRRIHTHYGVSQTDRPCVEQIVREEFGATPLDVIIDDASHIYRFSRRTFETAFPLLRPGGTYVLEDWGWAHWQHEDSHYKGQTPLSVLLMELLMLCASRPDLIDEVRTFSAFTFIHKSPTAPPLENFTLDGAYIQRDVALVSAEKLNLSGVAQLACRQVAHMTQRRVRRTGEKIKRALRRKRR